MTDTQISSFLSDCVVCDDDTEEGLGFDTLYGLYISWCVLGRKVPIPDSAFRTALELEGLRARKENGQRIYLGLNMVGPAARDYVLNSVPVWTETDPSVPVLTQMHESSVPSLR